MLRILFITFESDNLCLIIWTALYFNEILDKLILIVIKKHVWNAQPRFTRHEKGIHSFESMPVENICSLMVVMRLEIDLGLSKFVQFIQDRQTNVH